MHVMLLSCCSTERPFGVLKRVKSYINSFAEIIPNGIESQATVYAGNYDRTIIVVVLGSIMQC